MYKPNPNSSQHCLAASLVPCKQNQKNLSPHSSFRTVALRKDAGRWISNPQDVYDEMRALLSAWQVGIKETFFLEEEKDEKEHLDLVLEGDG